MICERFAPAPDLEHLIREYVLIHFQFGASEKTLIKSYPVNPEEGIIFLVRGSLTATTPELGKTHVRPKAFLFGLPAKRQDLHISSEYLMLCARFKPGGLYKLLGIPMTEFHHNYVDAALVLGPEIKRVYEELVNAADYSEMLKIVNSYFRAKIKRVKVSEQPFDRIGSMILHRPQSFNLERTANQACLSYRQFEKKFIQQVGVPAKHFSRICRFYQAYELKEHAPGRTWFDIAINAGYNDYQHLVKDFKEFTGTTPNIFVDDCQRNPERTAPFETKFRGA